MITRDLQNWMTTFFPPFSNAENVQSSCDSLHELMCSHEILNYMTAQRHKALLSLRHNWSG